MVDRAIPSNPNLISPSETDPSRGPSLVPPRSLQLRAAAGHRDATEHTSLAVQDRARNPRLRRVVLSWPGEYAPGMSSLGSNLQSGNLSAAQADFASIQQAMAKNGAQGAQGFHPHHHHGHHGGAATSVEGAAISQTLGQLGQALQSGDLQSAQQLFTSLQSDLQGATGSATTAHSSVSVMA
jgi:hypothetical protein